MSVVSMSSKHFIRVLLIPLLTTFSGEGLILSHAFAQETKRLIQQKSLMGNGYF